MLPSVGRIVHYTPNHDPERDLGRPEPFYAAIVTRVRLGNFCDLAVICPGNSSFWPLTDIPCTAAEAGTEEARGCWSWPDGVRP